MSDDLFGVVGPDNLLQAVNPAWNRLLGWTEADLVGRNPGDLIHPEDDGAREETRRSALDHGRFTGVELRYRQADGSFRWLLWSGHRDGDSWFVIGRDIAARKAAEQAFARRERRSRALLSALRDGCNVIDGDGRIVEVNDGLCAMTGYSAGELVGHGPPFPYWPDSEREAIAEAFAAAMCGERTHHELTFRRRDGELFPVAIDIAALPDEDGGFIAAIRDLSDEVRERRRLREAHEVARLTSWEWDPADDRIDPAATPNLTKMLTLVPSCDDGRVRNAIRSVFSGDVAEAVLEYPMKGPDREIAWVETRARPVLDADGCIVRVRGTTQDVTARKRAEMALELSEQRLRTAQRMADIGSFEVDYREGTVTWSDEMHRLFGLDPAAAPGVAEVRSRLLPPDDAAAVERTVDAVLSDGAPRSLEHGYRRGEEVRRAETRFERIERDGLDPAMRGTMQDITERKRAEREIHLQAHLLDSVDMAVIATDPDGTITHWNHGAQRMYGWTREDTLGRPINDFTVGPEAAGQADQIMESILATGQWEGEFEVRRADGTHFPAYVRDIAFTDSDGRPAGVVGVSVDITERVAAERAARSARDYQRAITDSMAEGLFSLDTDGRLIYMNRAAEAMLGWTQAELAGQIMHELTHYRRPDGSPYPFAECPFLHAREQGESIRVDDDLFVRKDGTELPVAVTAAPFETADGVRGSVVVFNDISDRKAQEARLRSQMESLSWIGRVRDALAEDRFVLHAQPIVDLGSGDTVSHELLIRMLDEDGSLVPPCEFLPAAEEYGLIVDIDRWVVRQAIGMASQGQAVELNLSGHSIAAPGLIDDFRDELARTGADPALIVVELTETALVADEAAAELFIARVEALGCGLALDDFGTGYGGFSYIKRLPVDFLKIDVEFVQDLTVNEASRHVVSAVVSLARGFGQRTVAEGVEDAATLELLKDFGVDYAQGYFLGRPIPAAEAFAATAGAATA
ncbi:MAG: hypothetical protein QOJ97_854 [Solirubrobacteraceae bacterium]|jgi:PAS domain S-box-containing protein|nr:hypothetical protein [Solirubrobacteraceae bacterium]